MAAYEIVAFKTLKGPCDYFTADNLRDAKQRLREIPTEPYVCIILRQYYTDRRNRWTFRVLHRLGWERDARR